MGFDGIFCKWAPLGASVGLDVFWGQILGFAVVSRLWSLHPEFWELALDILRCS